MLEKYKPETRGGDVPAAKHPTDLLGMLEEFFQTPSRFSSGLGFSEFERVPAMDVRETDEEVVVTAELPGLEAEELEVTLEKNMLVLKGEKKLEHEEKKENYIRRERSYGSFRRAVMLPCGVKEEEIKASYDKGILTIHLPKDESHKPKQITIS